MAGAYVFQARDWLRAGRNEGSEFKYRLGQEFSLLHIVQAGSGAHSASYTMDTGDKAEGAWGWPLTSNYCRGQENVDIYIHSPIRLHVIVLS
jgi:hypothetical protein